MEFVWLCFIGNSFPSSSVICMAPCDNAIGALCFETDCVLFVCLVNMNLYY